MPAGARTDSQQITLFDYYDFHIKTTCYHSAGKYLFNSHRGFDAGECHHRIISSPTFSGRTDYQCAEIECGHRCVFARFAHDD